MNEKLAAALAAIPEDRIPAVTNSVIVLLALVAALALYPPYLRLEQASDTHLQIKEQIASQALLKQSADQLTREVGPLEEQLPRSAASPDELVMSLMRKMESLSSQYQLTLTAVSPGASSPFLMLNETAIAIEVAGQYQNIVNWLHSVEGVSPSISLSQIGLKKGKTESEVVLNALISVYQYEAKK